jgi:hypothetical protein
MEMSGSPNLIIRHVILALFLSFWVGVGSFARDLNKCSPFYTTAIRLMRVFYPELSGKSVVVDSFASMPFEADGPPASFQISVSDNPPTEPITAAPYPSTPSSAQRVGHLSTHFQFDGRDGGLLHMFSSGLFVNGEKQEALKKLVDEHRDWSEAQMTDALATAGVKFGPNQKDAILAKFPVKEFEAAVGKIHIISASFTFRGNEKPPFYAVMEWSIRFQTTDGKHRDEYFASLEPFQGKVTSLGRRRVK